MALWKHTLHLFSLYNSWSISSKRNDGLRRSCCISPYTWGRGGGSQHNTPSLTSLCIFFPFSASIFVAHSHPFTNQTLLHCQREGAKPSTGHSNCQVDVHGSGLQRWQQAGLPAPAIPGCPDPQHWCSEKHPSPLPTPHVHHHRLHLQISWHVNWIHSICLSYRLRTVPDSILHV